MKPYASSIAFFVFSTAFAFRLPAQAQTCTSPVIAWRGHYSISGSGSGVGNGGYDFTISDSATGTVNADGGTVLGSCTQAEWSGLGGNFGGSMDDSGIETCPTGSPAPQETVSLSGPVGMGNSIIDIDLSKNTFFVFPQSEADATVKSLSCSGDTSSGTGWLLIIPANWANPTFNPPTFTLPKTIQPLKGSSPPGYQGLWGWGQVTIPWTWSYVVDPVLDPRVDDPCEWIVGSSVGCQDQSLAEDVPIVGTGLSLHYESNRSPANPAMSSVATSVAALNGGWTFSVNHVFDPYGQRLYLGDGSQRSQWQLGTLMAVNGKLLITSKDGSEIYVFDPTTLHHLQTLKPLTGAIKYQFAYDTSSRLISITDGSGNVTAIQRAANGLPTAIISPYGQTTKLAMNSNGFMNRVTDPAGHFQTFVYTATGLMTSRTDADGNTYSYAYNSSGAVTSDTDPLGGSTTFNETASSVSNGVYSHTINGTTPMHRVRVFGTDRNVAWAEDGTSYSEKRVNTLQNGLETQQSKTLQSGTVTETTQLPDGQIQSLTEGPDPRWGVQVPVPVSGSLAVGNLKTTFTNSRTDTLGTPGNPFTLSSETEINTVNGNAYKSSYTASNHTYTESSPVGRSVTTVLDSQERIISTEQPGLAPNNFIFDSHGRVSSTSHGTRNAVFTYDANGNLAGVTDAMGAKNSFTYDADANLAKHTRPDGQVVSYSHNASGNLTSVTPPSRTAHEFTYNSVGLLAQYTPPSVTGSGPTTYSYNLDRQISRVTRPDGSNIDFAYDDAGRVSSITNSTTTTNYDYSSTTGLLSSSAVVSGEAASYTYTGPFLAEVAWAGTIAGNVGHTYDDNFHVISRTINGGNGIAFKYDADGLMVNAGALSVTRQKNNGLLTGTLLGSTKDSYTYSSFGEVTEYSGLVNGSPLYSVTFTRDNMGRIVGKTEMIAGVKNSFIYGYDSIRRLVSVTENGSVISTYTYDGNSDRTSVVTKSGTTAATYNADDQLVTYGITTYSYTANGEISTETTGSSTTTFQYDGMGNLSEVTLPNGTKVTYILDANGRRMGKSINGALAEGFLYDGSRVIAQLTGTNQITSQFVYATRANSADYMVRGGVTYRIVSDHLGSPRLVVNTSTNQVMERIDYDEFGNVLVDTNPGFQPFGFAGGLYDATTKLVHFGARDYAPAIGRWLTKDPLLFAGADTNVYAYALSDPVNIIDPDGNESITITGYNGIGGGITISRSDGNTSVTIEIGIGTPTIGVETNPDGKAYTGEEMSQRTGDASKLTIFGEAGGEISVPVPGLGKVTLIDGKVGIEIEESPCPGKFEPPEIKTKGCVGPVCVGPDGVTQQLEGDPFEEGGEGHGQGHGEGAGGVEPSGKAGVRLTIPISL